MPLPTVWVTSLSDDSPFGPGRISGIVQNRGKRGHAQHHRRVILAGVLVVVSGLSIWKPVQLRWLVMLLGDFDAARLIHFAAMSAIVLFLVVHVAMALLVPKSLRAMIIGR